MNAPVPTSVDRLHWLQRIAADRRLPPLAAHVAIALTGFFNNRTGNAWPSIGRLADDLRISERWVRQNIAALKDCGHLAVEFGGGRSSTNTYTMIAGGAAETRNASSGFPGDKPGTPVQGFGDKPGTIVHLNPERQFRKTRNASSGELIERTYRKELFNSLEQSPPETRSAESASKSSWKPVIDETSFEEFWRAFPRKKAKGAAEKAYAAILAKRLASPAELLDGVRAYAAARANEDPKYTQHPATWLNGKGWLDQPEPTTSRTPSRQNRGGTASAIRAILED